jgi:ADP-ribose pyrophosphatase YjhB (NUDIX family)
MVSSRHYPDRPWVGVGVIVWRGSDVLLAQRGKEPRKGEWGLPGGAQELGETVFETAAREILEETGIVARPTRIVTVVDGIRRDEAGRVASHYTLVEVEAEWMAGEPVAADDAAAARFVPASEIEAWVTWEETLRVIGLSAAGRP